MRALSKATVPRACLAAAILAGAVAGAGCVPPDEPAPGPARPPAPPAGWDDGVRLPAAIDRNPAPGVVEIDLEATVAAVEIVPGAPSALWTYGGSLPGPLIRVPAGGRLIVHFTNRLPEETTIHWHGVRLGAEMDGVPMHSQAPVPPGGSFDYDFVVPDSGLFWYHPHVRSAKQVGDGLYGALLVEETAPGAGAPRAAVAGATGGAAPGDPLPDLGPELVLVLSDIGIDASGALHDPEAGGDLATLFGREGETVLVNGRVGPTVLARPGLRQRWRIVNAARSRYFQLAIAGHRFTRIGGDGGFIPEARESERLVIIPGERADVLMTPQGEPGSTLAVRWIPYDRGFGSTEFRPELEVLYLRLTADDPVTDEPASLPSVVRTIVPLDVQAATPRLLGLTGDTIDDKLVLSINGVPAWDAVPLHARVGDTEIWTIENRMDWDHPFHLHGFFFQPVDVATGAPPPLPEWKDTFNVPRRQTVALAVRFEGRPGMWMFHCHILDHADAGMMGMVHLER